MNKISKQVRILCSEAYPGVVFSELKRLKLCSKSRIFKEIVPWISACANYDISISCHLVQFLSKPHVVQQPPTIICENRMNHKKLPRRCQEIYKKMSNLVWLNIRFILECYGFVLDSRTCYLHVICNVLSRALESEHTKGEANEKRTSTAAFSLLTGIILKENLTQKSLGTLRYETRRLLERRGW